MKKYLFLFLMLALPALLFADNFDSIRKESTYWMPYRTEGSPVMIIINKKMEMLTDEEQIEVYDAIKQCTWDKDTTVGKCFILKLDNLEALLSKNFPKLSNSKYPADINEIMIDIKQLDKFPIPLW